MLLAGTDPIELAFIDRALCISLAECAMQGPWSKGFSFASHSCIYSGFSISAHPGKDLG